MNIDDLTLGQVKEFQSIFSKERLSAKNLAANLIGKYVIIRSRNEGLNAGVLVEADETGVVLKEARRIMLTITDVENETKEQTLLRTDMGRNLENADLEYIEKNGRFAELKYIPTVWEHAFGIHGDIK